VLEVGVGDKTLGQSTTICRYLGRKFKLSGANEWEAAKCDEYVDAINDLLPGKITDLPLSNGYEFN
jgi:glutathione S-transferase